MAASDQFVDRTTSASVEEKAKLQKHFSRFDIYFFLICTIVGVDTLGQVAQNGAQGFLWLIVLAVFFFVPYALLTAELGSAFTEEGGAYIWTRMSFGRLTAAINAVFYWFSNPIWIGATLALLCCAAIQNYFYSFSDGSAVYYIDRPGLHLVLGLLGDPVVRYRQVDPNDWCVVSDYRDRPVLDHDGHLRVQTRPALPVRFSFQPDLDGVHRACAAAVLQLRGLRAAQRGR